MYQPRVVFNVVILGIAALCALGGYGWSQTCNEPNCLGMTLSGAISADGYCLNKTTGEMAQKKGMLGDVALVCEEMGLSAPTPGQKVKIWVNGTVGNAGILEGDSSGITIQAVACENETANQTVPGEVTAHSFNCGSATFEENDKFEVALHGIIPDMPNNGFVSPYNLAHFQPVIDASKIQAPNSTPAACGFGKCAGFADWFFYLDETGQYMTFEMQGNNTRSELRQKQEWQTSTSSWVKMTGQVKVFFPDSSLDQFTFMQIHDSGDLNKPLIRANWQRLRAGQMDHLWAVVRQEGGNDSAIQWFDLGPRPDEFFKAEIKVKNNHMWVLIDDAVVVDIDVSYWEGLNLYFKAGVYLQGSGEAKVQFSALAYHG